MRRWLYVLSVNTYTQCVLNSTVQSACWQLTVCRYLRQIRIYKMTASSPQELSGARSIGDV